MKEILLWVASLILTSGVTWYIAWVFYNRGKKDYENTISKLEEVLSILKEGNKSLINEVKQINYDDKIALRESRISKTIDDYLVKGTPKYMIDTFTDLSQEEKAEMYDLILLRAKGKVGITNPYK